MLGVATEEQGAGPRGPEGHWEEDVGFRSVRGLGGTVALMTCFTVYTLVCQFET